MVNWRRATSRISKKWAVVGSVLVGIVPTAAIVTTMSNPASSAVIVNSAVGVAPGAVAARSVIAFPSRDFVSAFGYPGDTVVVTVTHDPDVYPGMDPISSEPSTPTDAAGTVEVNHPGGVCWVGNTPDIRPGDLIHVEVVGGPDLGLVDETVVANVTDKRAVQTGPGTVVVHGTASDSPLAGAGLPLPSGQVEQRLVSPGNLFDANGRRTLRAVDVPGAGDGLLTFDPVDVDTNPLGLNWTATYSGLTQHDVDLAIGAESRALWLGAVALPAVESTIFENGALTFPGPTAPCLAPIEVLPPPPGSELVPPTDPSNLTGAISNSNTVTLNWDAATDNVGVTGYGIYRNNINIFTVSNADGSAPAPTTYQDKNIPPGSYSYDVVALDEVGNKSGHSNVVGPYLATSQLAPGTFPVTINEPPVLPTNIIVFPSRDFVSPSGYLASDTVSVQLLRKGPDGNMLIISSADGIIPNDEGFAEVNHPGGACWAGITPEMRVGDIIRTIAYDPAYITGGNPDGVRTIDQTTVAGVSAERPVTVTAPTLGNSDGVVEVHGSALGADGNPLPLDQIEQRMIAVHGVGLWDLNGRRALRAGAGADGTLTYDTVNNPMGVNWTATYSGLDQADVDRMAEADTRIHWLGTKPLLLAEATIYENADNAIPGPSAPGCSSPLEAADIVNPTTPGGFAASVATGNDVTLTWAPSTDDWYVAGYRIYDGATAVANVPATATSILLADQTFGPHTFSVRAFDTATPRGAGADIIAQLTSARGQMYGNLSVATPPITVNVADVTAPSAPTNVIVTTTETGNPEDHSGTATITWTASTDDVAVDHYVVHRNPSFSGSPVDFTVAGNVTSFTDGLALPGLGLEADTYLYTVEAFDAATNHTTSASVTAVITNIADLTNPSDPTNAVATTTPDIHGRTIVVTWAASTDNVHVSGYGVYRSTPAAAEVLLTTVNGTTLSYTDANLPAGTYTYRIDAVDSSGNRSAQSAGATAVVANDPPVAPHSLIAFPARDFISATGYTPFQNYTFTLIRGANTVFAQSFPADSTGLIEVNHPGGTCWLVNTPNIKPGDVVRITDDSTGVAEQTTVADITAERPIATGVGTITVHGTAKTAAGTQIPVEQVESRLIVGTATSFDVNGRRLLRASSAGGDGTLSYDSATSTNWTAVYTGLSANDVFRAVGGLAPNGTTFVGAESRGHWLGRDPLALTEATIFENGTGVIGGPSAPCTAPAETPVPAASTNVTSRVFPPTTFLPAPATSAPLSVVFSNGGASTLNLSNIYLAGANRGDFTIVPGVGACPTAFPAQLLAGASCTVFVTFRPTALGLRQANVSFSDDAANTTDQTVTLTGLGADNTDPILTVTNAQPVTFGNVAGGGATSVRTINISNTGTGLALSINSVAVTGDFTAIPTGCASVSNVGTAPANVCSVQVTFKPTAIGARTGTLVLNHSRTLNGATTTSITLTGNGSTGSVLGFTSNNITFGTVNRNTTKDQKIVVKNTGNAAATGMNLPTTFTVGGANFTRVGSDCGATLAVNGSCSVTVRYSAPNVVGSFAGTTSVVATNSFNTATTALTVTTR